MMGEVEFELIDLCYSHGGLYAFDSSLSNNRLELSDNIILCYNEEKNRGVQMSEAGHKFLAKLGKKRLRPGGKRATDWLIAEGGFSKEKRILEVACNRGTTAIELAQRFGCKITAVDMDAQALEVAKKSAETAGVAHLISFERANGMKLPYEDASFDIVINEAMLTMQADQAKKNV